MHNTFIASTVTLRTTKGSLPFSYNECNSYETRPFIGSASRPTCYCSFCDNSLPKVPITPNYSFNLYGFRQSSLIQCRKSCFGGFDRCYYSRVPVCNVGRRCCCDGICNFREKSSYVRKGGLRKCMVFEERRDSYGFEGLDEAEAMLSLLSEDLGNGYLNVRKGSERLIKKPVVEKRENCSVRSKNRGSLESDSRFEYELVVSNSRKGDNRRREERAQKDELRECILRKENQKDRIWEDKREVLLRKTSEKAKENQKDRIRDELRDELREGLVRIENQKDRIWDQKRDVLLRKTSERAKENQKDRIRDDLRDELREGLLRIENQKDRIRDELRDELRNELREGILSIENQKDRIREELRDELREGTLRKENQKDRIRDGKRDVLLRKANEKVKEELEEESLLRKDNFRARPREEDREELTRSEEHRGQRLRKDGSSGSTYYSLSSSGDYEYDKDIELKKEKIARESSSGYKSNIQSNNIVYEESREENLRRGDYIQEYGAGLTKKITAQVSNAGSSVTESGIRKKSEKKLVEEMESRKATTQSESELSSGYRKSSDSYMKSTGNTKVDVKKKLQSRERSDEVSNQSETRTKYKQSEEISDTNIADVRTSYGSQKIYSGKDEFQKTSRMGFEVSDSVDVDVRRTSDSQKKFEASVKTKEDYSTKVSSSVYGEEKQHNYVEARGKSQELTKKESTSILNKHSDRKFTKQDENINLANSSSLKEASAIIIEEDDKNKFKIPERASTSHLGARGALPVESTSGIISDNVSHESSQFGYTSLHRPHLEKYTALRLETYGEHDQSKAHEDAIESAARFQESSAHYVGEFINSRPEFVISEIPKEKKTNIANLEEEEKIDKKNMVQSSSGDSGSKGSLIKGPSVEMWKVDEPFVQQQKQEQPKVEVQEDEKKADNAIVKRNGKSLWNVISDVVHLRWTPRPDSRSSGRKTGEKSSSNQSTSSEAWFSGHEAEESEERSTMEKEGRITKQESISKGSSNSSNLAGHLAINPPSPPVRESSLPSNRENSQSNFSKQESLVSIKLQEEKSPFIFKGSSSSSNAQWTSVVPEISQTGEIAESSISVPTMRLRRSPVVRLASKTEEENISMEQSEEMVNEGELRVRKLQRKDQIPNDRFDEWEEACKFEAEQRQNDEMFMREALLEAKKAADHWEVPVGAVLVHKGQIIARGWNLVEELRDSTAHAEMICIREASNVLRTWRLSETTLYVTLEPCPMCAGAILQARIDTVVWGAPNKLLGADGSWIRLFPSGDGEGNGLEETNKPAAPVHPFHPKIIIRRGVLASECAEAMQQFFKLRRKKKDKKPESTPSPSSPPPSCLPISRHDPSKILTKMHNPSKILTKMHGAFNFIFCL